MSTGRPYITQADLGGQTGHGAIAAPAPEELPLHSAWEGRALALTLAMGATGQWNIDMSRAARETLDDYAQRSYYQIWLAALENLLGERGLVATDELAAGQAVHAARPLPRIMRAGDVAAALARGSPTLRSPMATAAMASQMPAPAPDLPSASVPPAPAAAQPAARFAVGDAVTMRADEAPHHTRRPRYTWGKAGRVVRIHGAHVFADSHAQGLGEQPQWLYAVQFDGTALWGDLAEAGSSVTLDAWESYLQPLNAAA